MRRHRIVSAALGLCCLAALGLALLASAVTIRSLARPVFASSPIASPAVNLEQAVLEQAAQALGCGSSVGVVVRPPEVFSEAIYQAAIAQGLFSSTTLHQIYLPLLMRSGSDSALPDLRIDSMVIEADPWVACDDPPPPLGLTVHFSNIGDGDASPFVLDANGEELFLPGLAARSSSVARAQTYVAGGPNTAFIDSTDLVAESDETNNRLSQMLPIPTPLPPCTPTHTPTPTRTATPTPTPTVTTWPTGDLWWSRQVHVYDARVGPQAGVSGARVDAVALSTDTCTTDSSGNCMVTVHAHDTGTVRISVSASGYQSFSGEYSGMPPSGIINIGLTP